jgi:hypothetical protein
MAPSSSKMYYESTQLRVHAVRKLECRNTILMAFTLISLNYLRKSVSEEPDRTQKKMSTKMRGPHRHMQPAFLQTYCII